MLLDLFASSVEGRRISVTSACIASGVPTSTALLWISKLAAKNLIVRRPDPADRRRTFLEITPEASGAVVAWTERLFSPE
jgi:DNA-binding MarR family transcriptional regulator